MWRDREGLGSGGDAGGGGGGSSNGRRPLLGSSRAPCVSRSVMCIQYNFF